MAPNLWQSGLVTIYRGDCREIMPDLAEASVDAVITDPVWPDASVLLQGRDDPDGLFREAAAQAYWDGCDWQCDLEREGEDECEDWEPDAGD